MSKINKFITSLSNALVVSVLLIGGVTSCTGDDEPGISGSFKPVRMNISEGETLAILSSGSRADGDESSYGLFKVDANGNVTAVETIVHHNEDGSSSTETLNLRMSATDMVNVTDDLILFLNCGFYDENNEERYFERSILVNKSTGLIYSLSDLSDSTGLNFFGSYNTQENPTSFIFCSPWESALYRISISGDDAVAKQLISKEAPVFNAIQQGGRLFSLSGNKVGLCRPGDEYYDVSVVYANGGYENFKPGIQALLSNSIMVINTTYDSATGKYDKNFEWIHLGDRYGQTTTETFPAPAEITNLINPPTITSWYESGEDVFILLEAYYGYTKQQNIISFNTATKQFAVHPVQFSGDADLKLWAENFDGNRFYGLVRNESGEITAACWVNPATFDYGETALNLSDIDITTVVPDYRNGMVQLIGMRRSDGYKVAVNVDLHQGKYTTIFSNPNLTIQTLIRLN